MLHFVCSIFCSTFAVVENFGIDTDSMAGDIIEIHINKLIGGIDGRKSFLAVKTSQVEY